MGLHVLVLAGGSGTQLWPLSREALPKHLLPLAPGGRTLLRATVERVLDLGDTVSVVTAAAQAARCVAELQPLGLGEEAVIAEPLARGTGPALGLAVTRIARDDPAALIVSIHADHRVADADGYRAAVIASAGWAAGTGGLATVGIRPSSAATGFGYIELAAPLEARLWREPSPAIPEVLQQAAAALPAFTSGGFVEKPDQERAEAYVSGGQHLWNLGLFAWPAGVFLEELRSADGLLAAALEHIAELQARGQHAESARLYAALDPQPVEPLVLERSQRLTVVEAGFDWSDVGSWPDLHAARAASGDADSAGNVSDGDTLFLDSSGCTVEARGGRFVAVVGARDLVVIDTPDALLVVPSAEAQRVREVVQRLRAEGRETLL